MTLLKHGLLLVCLLSLIGCSNTPPIVRTVTVTQTVYVLPPPELMSECVIPKYMVQTNLQLFNYSVSLLGAIKRCNIDWRALKDWREAKANEQSTSTH
ncbi:Rz1-like lysis system protein LysC [Shewanella cutis]|uniref:Rz1-like lysis system protein LysC n=1 Tax=Shewanella cutis TaxID=2766780 RepID=UPI003CFF5115